MPDILTAERALGMARTIMEADIYEVEDVALFALRSASAEASEEACVNCGCDHRYTICTQHPGECVTHQCILFLSRRAFLDEQARKVEGK